MLDWLLGKRFVKGWPRGVRPVFPAARSINDYVSENYPDVWAHVGPMPPYEALTILQQLGIVTGVRPGALLEDVRIV